MILLCWYIYLIMIFSLKNHETSLSFSTRKLQSLTHFGWIFHFIQNKLWAKLYTEP